jgi:hypothetical protein
LPSARKKIVDDAQTAPAAFPAACVGPSKLSETSGAWHEIAKRWIASEFDLQHTVFFLAQVAGHLASERRRLDYFHSAPEYAPGV